MHLTVNGTDVEIDDRHESTPLLWVLRDVLGLPGTKFGCGAGFCAACTVLVDGHNEKSCQLRAGRAVGRQITTVEAASGPVVDAVRDAWHRDNVVQCGYCQPGQTLAAAALLETDGSPDDAAISRWMNGNICRCGTYPRIRHAIHEAAVTIASGQSPAPLATAPDVETVPLSDADAADPVHPYLRIRDDGIVVVFSSQIEMGQGIHTGLATIVAEELDADVRVGPCGQRRQRAAGRQGRVRESRAWRVVPDHGSFELDQGCLGQLPAHCRQSARPARRRRC